jgi:primosomal protein N' (replication factor Y)
VIVQTYSPENYAVQAAARHDFEAFYREEIDFRRKSRYPPFSRLARFLFRHQKEEVCAAEAEEQSRMLARHARSLGVAADLIGPTPAFVGKLRGKYQWHVILRAAVDEFDELLDGLPVRAGWTVDIDPSSLL